MAKTKGYSKRVKFTEDEINQLVDEGVTSEDACLLIASLVDTLYGPKSDENWGADTLDQLAQLLDKYGLAP